VNDFNRVAFGIFCMIRFFKRNYGLMFALVFLLGFQFLFFPSHHYHIENIHAHSGELSPHQHQGQPHAPEPFQGEEHHHSNPFDDSHSDTYEINLHKSSLKPESPFKTVKTGDDKNSLLNAEPIFFLYVFPDTFLIENSGLPDRPKERSPPTFLI
jgi:hypothetical protein